MSDSSEEEDDDEDRIREELKDLIDDAPIDDDNSDDDGDSDGSGSGGGGREKRKKKSDDEDELDDRLEDDDYDLIEENLGVKVQRHVCWEAQGFGIVSEIQCVFFVINCRSVSNVCVAMTTATANQRWMKVWNENTLPINCLTVTEMT